MNMNNLCIIQIVGGAHCGNRIFHSDAWLPWLLEQDNNLVVGNGDHINVIAVP